VSKKSGAYTASIFSVKQFFLKSFSKDFLVTLTTKTTRKNQTTPAAERRI